MKIECECQTVSNDGCEVSRMCAKSLQFAIHWIRYSDSIVSVIGTKSFLRIAINT